MQSTDDDDVLMTRIQEHLEHQSKLIAAALALCCVAVLSFFAGKQSFAVFSKILAFGWSSIVALLAVSAS